MQRDVVMREAVTAVREGFGEPGLLLGRQRTGQRVTVVGGKWDAVFVDLGVEIVTVFVIMTDAVFVDLAVCVLLMTCVVLVDGGVFVYDFIVIVIMMVILLIVANDRPARVVMVPSDVVV